ncbi:MAG: prepilin-type N-terminal cleavage/methylation domain-containing protein [Gammaproteobacteria bacterium]|nr:prepilin-type N-terminal cleavage/methylation domain-containing protein [Gammaproteobacteria bacterium]MCP5135407.1 prepilin-type N-terminal cleavage/methylation domain-containing protein [Gammaproteobacteria bacterium]
MTELRQRGFTLVELALVLGAIVSLISIGSSWQAREESAKVRSTVAALSYLVSAADDYWLSAGPLAGWNAPSVIGITDFATDPWGGNYEIAVRNRFRHARAVIPIELTVPSLTGRGGVLVSSASTNGQTTLTASSSFHGSRSYLGSVVDSRQLYEESPRW